MTNRQEHYDDDGIDPDYEDSFEWSLDWICGMGSDGQCSMAGTEECDWDCPRMR